LLLHEVEQFKVVLCRGPGGEGDEGRADGDACRVYDTQRLLDIGARVALCQMRQYSRAKRRDRRDDERAAYRTQFGDDLAALQDVLDLDRRIEGDGRELGAQRPHNRQRMPRSVQEIGIAEGDVARARRYLRANILQHNRAWHDEETPAIDRRDGAVQAGMQAAARRL